MTTSQWWLPLLVCNQVLWRQVFYQPPPWGLEVGCTQHVNVRRARSVHSLLNTRTFKSLSLGGGEVSRKEALEEEEDRQVSLVK